MSIATTTYTDRNEFLDGVEKIILDALSEGRLKRGRWGSISVTASARHIFLLVAGRMAGVWTVIDGLTKSNGLYEEAIAFVRPKIEAGIEAFKASRLDVFANEAA